MASLQFEQEIHTYKHRHDVQFECDHLISFGCFASLFDILLALFDYSENIEKLYEGSDAGTILCVFVKLKKCHVIIGVEKNISLLR